MAYTRAANHPKSPIPHFIEKAVGMRAFPTMVGTLFFRTPAWSMTVAVSLTSSPSPRPPADLALSVRFRLRSPLASPSHARHQFWKPYRFLFLSMGIVGYGVHAVQVASSHG